MLDNDVQVAVMQWFRQQPRDFFADGYSDICISGTPDIRTGFNCGCLMHFKVIVWWLCSIFLYVLMITNEPLELNT